MTSFHIAINYISSLSTVWTLPGNVVRAVMGADKLKDCLTDEICKETQNSKPSLPYNCKVQSTEWQRQNNYKDKKGKDKFHLHENEKKAVSLNSETSISQSQRKLAKQVSIIQRQKKSPVNFNI